MVKAILAGRKTQTRRLFFATPGPCAGGATIYGKGYPKGLAAFDGELSANGLPCAPSLTSGCLVDIPCPHGMPGDRLWVREAFSPWADEKTRGYLLDQRDEYASDPCIYRETVGSCSALDAGGLAKGWTPSIFMPRALSRITLAITAVRVERLTAISDDEIVAEGVDVTAVAALLGRHVIEDTPLRDLWRLGWDAINGKRLPYSSDPWVWVVGFTRIAQIGSSS